MKQVAPSRRARISSYDRLVAIGLAIVAVISPLYIDRRTTIDPELEDEPINFSSYLPLLLGFLIIAIAISRCLDQSCTRYDPDWIYRVCGSSGGIVILLLLLALILKCKACTENLEG